MNRIDKLLAEAAKRHINDKRAKVRNMTNEELNAGICRLKGFLGIEDGISNKNLKQRIKDLWDSMTSAERNEAKMLSKKGR